MGSFTKQPPEKSIQIVGLAGGEYWPQSLAGVEITETAWKGRSFGDGDYMALAVYVGENGRILFDYFQKAGDFDSSFPGIDVLPADVIECDSVYIPIP